METKTREEGMAGIRPLSVTEIDKRIDGLISEVLSPLSALDEADGHEPRWISAGELVRRMRPFLVLN